MKRFRSSISRPHPYAGCIANAVSDEHFNDDRDRFSAYNMELRDALGYVVHRANFPDGFKEEVLWSVNSKEALQTIQ